MQSFHERIIANRPPKVIFDNGRVLQATHINGYLMDATHFHFGVLTSGAHNAWVRAVCGRLKSDYDYSIKIVYNNFPWPDLVNVANEQMLPKPNANTQLENGSTGTGNTSTMATLARPA